MMNSILFERERLNEILSHFPFPEMNATSEGGLLSAEKIRRRKMEDHDTVLLIVDTF